MSMPQKRSAMVADYRYLAIQMQRIEVVSIVIHREIPAQFSIAYE